MEDTFSFVAGVGGFTGSYINLAAAGSSLNF